MALDYVALQSEIAALIADLGAPCSLSVGGKTLKGYGVKLDVEKNDDPRGSVHPTSRATQTIYVKGSLKSAPSVGDTITFADVTYRIDLVEAYRPATTTVAYRLEVTA